MHTSAKKRVRKQHHAYYSRSTIIALRAVFAVAQLVPPLAVRLAYRLFYVPRSRRRGALSLQGVQHVPLHVRGKAIHGYCVGVGRPVLLLHGWESAVSRCQPLIHALVQAGFQVVTFDMPAHGHSEGRETDILEICEVATELEQRFGPFAVALGHSYGGICLVNLLRQGMPVDKLVLFATPASYESMIQRFASFLGLWPWVKSRFVRAINHRYAPYRLEEHFNTTRNLALSARPTLVVHDVNDKSVPFHEATLLARAHPQVSLLVTEGLGHNKVMSDATVISRCIEFLAEKTTWEPRAHA